MYPVDILNQRHTRFVLWVPQSDSSTAQPPVLVIGTTDKGAGVFQEIGRFPLAHSDGVQFLADVVMAFGHDPYSYIDFDNFHLKPDLEPDNPDSYQSDRNGQLRDGFGGNSWRRYIRSVHSYDPETGDVHSAVHPSWAFHRCHLARWMTGFGAVNYITSHDIEGPPKARLYNFLIGNGIRDVEKRTKLAFALLLTSVGTPMIFAGEEFADQMDRSVDMGKKQSDPVNYERKNDGGWRQALFGYVANLVRFRAKCPALGEDDTEFLRVDVSRGGRIMAWLKGDENNPGAENVIANWPDRDQDGWREISQGREVPLEWVGREPLAAWEAKVYTRWTERP
ncbi:glycoside hydrolase family 13 protein [Thermothelomyces thermophilus ATCC 42464]|uniref:Glycoside hydrolase family 13 protein n=1 Tax=Thermothelomyces thermophilus (strain ATCC 42464 / BCRC 31852 / DSM 1799) TaxID=573729 RepID=G2Q5C6_THET4|nr:glycoside hydrolase family 13 protein [Thermothelomyces thermophilus ATCC 42464]AEO53757.1 glycoside hydrolase family 13 protein [Thermothelomyces thermophilus ATCC 42464]